MHFDLALNSPQAAVFCLGWFTVCLVFLEAWQSKGSCCAEFSPGYCLLEIPDTPAVLMLRNCSVCRNSLLEMCYSVDHYMQSMSDVWKCQACCVCPDSAWHMQCGWLPLEAFTLEAFTLPALRNSSWNPRSLMQAFLVPAAFWERNMCSVHVLPLRPSHLAGVAIDGS